MMALLFYLALKDVIESTQILRDHAGKVIVIRE